MFFWLQTHINHIRNHNDNDNRDDNDKIEEKLICYSRANII